MRRRAGIPASNRQARCGAVAFIQRFSDALNLDFHVQVLDGIYVIDSKGEPVFRRVPPPTDKEVSCVAERIHRRVARLMEKRGLGSQADPDEADGLRRDEPLLAELYGASVSGRVATGPRAGMRITRVGDEVDPEDGALPSGPCCASVTGFSVHAGVCVPARDRLRLERLARYAGRPPLATERLSLLPDGRLLYRLKRRWRDGTTHVIYEPLELMERLAALVHPPRFNITRYYGMFAPAASLRPRVIPETEDSSPPRHPGCQSGVEAPATDPGETKKKRGRQPKNYSWATLMARVLELDVLACPRCGGRMRILAAIDSPDAIHKILTCLGLPTRAPPIAPAVSDPDMAFAW
ncbi:MAG: transposase [Acidobacteriota bacterium]